MPEQKEERRKPTVVLTDGDGNVFLLIGKASKALKRAAMYTEAAEFSKRALGAGSYDEVLQIIMEYCEVE